VKRALSIAAALGVAAALSSSQVSAKPAIVLEASPILGPDTPSAGGWLTCSARVRNPGSSAMNVTLELSAKLTISGGDTEIVTRAPLALPAGGTVLVQMPTHGLMGSPPRLELRAVDKDGVELAKIDPGPGQSSAPMLFDVASPSRVSTVLASRPIWLRGRAYGARYFSGGTLAVGAARNNPATGDPILPESAAGYASATVVLARSSALARLPVGELRALADWVLAGGGLAVVVDRPEDLDGPVLSALIGSRVESTDAPDTLRLETLFVVPESPSSFGSSGPKGTTQSLAPSELTAASLTGYAAPNLRSSPWGASASYGLGEVHLLPFDPAREATLGDPWAQQKLVDLVRHTWDRSNFIALRNGTSEPETYRLEAIRRFLDPNEATRWTVGVSAILLLIYAVLAGPVNFHLARKKNRPLRALAMVPIWSFAMILAIVVIGMLGKGLSGKARRLTLVEAGAGMSRASAVRFRGYYASSSGELSVRPTSWDAVLDVLDSDEETERTLVVDADGARLEQFRSKPWKTVLVREDGFIQLGAGISIVPTADGDYVVHNRTARDLLGGILKVPGRDAGYFPLIKDGEAVRLSKATKTFSGVGKLGGMGAVHVLGNSEFEESVDKAGERLGSAWEAIGNAASTDADFWPHDVPVLIAALDGGEGRTHDGGLAVDVDRVLVRVVGLGGVP
jgi:hypothetical protein